MIDYRTVLRQSLSIYTLVLCLQATAVQAEIPSVPESSLIPDEKHELATEIITHIIGSYHYKNKELNDELSANILDRYLDGLDSNRSYFLASDINAFEKYRNTLDDALRKEDLTPAFDIFRQFRRRVDERVDYAIKLLEQDFTFEVDETYTFDRTEMPWPKSQQAMEELWRQRVKNDILNLRLANKEPEEYKSTLRKRYERIRTSTHQLNGNDVFQTFINAYTTAIEPHTAYFSPRVSENFDISMRLSLEGIGAVLSSDNDYTLIQQIITGGPADISKQVFKDDRIVGVGQGETGEIIDVIGWRLDDVVDLIRGPKDTIVRLEILPQNTGPEGPHKVITLTRNKIKLEEQAAKSSVIEIGNGRNIGVIRVPTFYIDFAAQARGDKDYKSTSQDVRKLIADLRNENITGLVIDLRGNGGGSLSEALELTGLFIESGPIVQTKDSSGHIEVNNDPNPGIVYAGPLAVLVDRNSASASEIFAGAIQDYQRGIIIGEPTFGKGTVQNVVDLNRFIRSTDEDHGKLKTTIAQFFRVSGGSNQFKGVVPDITFPTASDANDYGERSLDNALPWDQVKPAEYVKVNAPLDKIAVAYDQHRQRIKTDTTFNLLMDELSLLEQANARKSLSLLESRRKQERDELMTAKRKLQNELRLSQGLPPLPEDASDEILEAEADADPENDEKNDILLRETAMILGDVIKLSQPDAGLQAGQQPAPVKLNSDL